MNGERRKVMNAKHTPGEWHAEVCPYGVRIHSDESRDLAWLGHSTSRDKTENIANGKLMAASPALLEALEESTKLIEELYGWEPIEARPLSEMGDTYRGPRKDMPKGMFEFSNEAGIPPEELALRFSLITAAINKAKGL